ncbi:O-succinylhomoserine (thiol)-lyase [Photobacterium aquimaris]|uniref:O-succinylhomoserine (Thiol)-lyase n=1 Tax=Photobacterium aquimaris TaxID=512643 RepID=A0A2T3IJX6_9GAMM|nr:O-succinylhomoserine (thiol)-lyase [Photobacterium aquimaris]OBU09539.1 O-succinylhomoserine (thiol)-lyase [Photobacterium aquimaris]OBU13755.1 O-succinylhomoserine (thiol)-lyase [Photobacterium aquimaris]PSU28648.1 O-succinylhomoserine (thiol)-lyase [Photobacterium aquimaris]PSW00950.1 O-succinylhomoserine (thiol)-lyase [Photobacterium aquimaris]
MSDKQLATIAVRTGIDVDSQYNAVVPPIYLTSTYSFPALGELPQYDYSRSGNPTRNTLADALSDMEGGAGAVVTSCGTSAMNLLVSALLGPDDLLVAPHDCYGGSYRLFNTRAQKGDFKVLFIDQADPDALAAALAQKPTLLWLETPSNPLVRVIDIEVISQQAQAVDCQVAVDNTFLSPLLQQPLSLGADFVVHSTTKYINGHSDVVGGVLIAKQQSAAENLTWWANCIGATGAPFDAYLTLRGLRTLAPRMRMHEENGAAVLAYLQQQPLVGTIYHPSLPTHPGHEIAKRQQRGFGSMMSFEFAGTDQQLQRFVKTLQLFSLAESLGGTESLIAHPASMTHRAMTDEAQRAAGISTSLLRLSVGLEDPRDLIADLTHAFTVAQGEC